MKIAKTLLLIGLCAAVVVGVSVFGTLAYLVDTDADVNTFTVGKVQLRLDETDVDRNGKPIEGAGRVLENEYHLVPGGSYMKDPTVTVLANSEEAYVRMVMTVHNASAVQAIIDKCGLTDYADLFSGWNEELWLYEGFTTAENTISFEFRYKGTVSADSEDLMLAPLFTGLVVPQAVESSDLKALSDSFKIVVNAHAIQASGFEASGDASAEDAAWAAFEEQYTL